MKTAMKPTLSKRAQTFRLVLLLAGVLLAMPQMALAQSVWTSPFAPAPEHSDDKEDPYTSWGADSENQYSNPWGVDDGSGTDDPWGTEDRWDADNPWGTGSDWSDDFYDFDNKSDSNGGSAERVGGGPMMMGETQCQSETCNANQDCCIVGGNFQCRESGECPGGGQSDNGPIGEDEFVDENGEIVCTNPGSTECDNATRTIPVDGALIYLLIAGLGYGAYKLRGF